MVQKLKVAATTFATEVFTLCIAVSCQADGMSLKQKPLGGRIVPLGGRVGIDDVEDGVEDEGENRKTVSKKRTLQHRRSVHKGLPI